MVSGRGKQPLAHIYVMLCYAALCTHEVQGRSSETALHTLVPTNVEVCYLDSAATSQKPRAVLDALQHFYEEVKEGQLIRGRLGLLGPTWCLALSEPLVRVSLPLQTLVDLLQGAGRLVADALDGVEIEFIGQSPLCFAQSVLTSDIFQSEFTAVQTPTHPFNANTVEHFARIIVDEIIDRAS